MKLVVIKRIAFAILLFSMFALVSCSFKGCTAECSHEWDGGVLINATECGENAIARFTCLKCGKTQEGNAKNHNYILESNEPPTCTGMGYDEYQCTRCDARCVSNFVNALGHNYDYDAVVKEATCIAIGTHEKVCANCGDSYRYSQNATGHSYVLIADEDSAFTYECEHCLNSITIGDGETLEEFVENEELFDVETTFTFDIISSHDEDYIKNNLKILDNFYNNSEYENNPNVLNEYSLTYKGSDVWTVSAVSNYEYSTTYIAKLQNDISFADYDGTELTFTIINDPNHENVYEYQDGIVFLQALENASAGYYPYNIVSSEESEYLYLTINKIDSLQKGMILCVGEVTSFEQILGNTECYLGKITDFYPLANGQWMVVLGEPDATEVFEELDIFYSGEINFDDEDVNIEQIKTELISSLYENEDYIKFLSVINVSASKYYANNGYYAEELSDIKSFMDKIKIEPEVELDGTKLIATVKGSLTLPIKNGSKEEIGSFNVGFTVGLTSSFNFKVRYVIFEHTIRQDEIVMFDLGITQTDTFDFNFHVSIDIHQSLEEHPYVQNTVNGKIHRRGCVHLSNVTDTYKYKGLSAETAAQYIKDNSNLGCNHCQPVTGFKSDLVVLNTKSKVIHAYGCAELTNILDENKKLSKEKSSYWMALGYTCCQWCHPDSREEFEYESIYTQTLYCSDWQQVATNMSQWAKDSGIKESSQKGITLTKVDFPIFGPVTATLEVRFVLTLDIEASFEYEYSYKQTNVYGIRKQGNDMQPYTEKLYSKELSNHCSVIGEIEVKAGLLVDANINIAGFSKWVRAGVTAEVGAYARIAGILSWSNSTDENYRAAYFEVGIYLDVNAYYKILWWDGELPVYEDKWPLLTMGYERAYFGYETYHDKIVINGFFDIDGENLLRVKYFDLKTMTTKTDELSLSETRKYTVNITFADGSYCEIKNGRIVPKNDAPEQFTDTMIITVESDSDWNNFAKGKYVYYLGYYEIEIEFIKEQPYVRDGDYIYFGEYPQTIKADDVTITQTQDSRGYYLGSDGCYYAKITAAPYSSGYIFSTGETVSSETVYYFKVEPIRWRILDEENGEAFILCDSIIANQRYDDDLNNYADSEIRLWLNDTFYGTAFTSLQQEIILTTDVDNSLASTGESWNPCICENTNDKIFLLSQAEATNTVYGFASDTSDTERIMLASDYSIATGVQISTQDSYYGIAWWWLRSPYYESNLAYIIGTRGYINYREVDGVYEGVVPALRIMLVDNQHIDPSSTDRHTTITIEGIEYKVFYCTHCYCWVAYDKVDDN